MEIYSSYQPPKFYSIALTNEKGIKTYAHICVFYEEIEHKDLISSLNTSFNNNEDFNSYISNNANSNNMPSSFKTAVLFNFNNFGQFKNNTKDNSIFVPVALCFRSYLYDFTFFANIIKEIELIRKFYIKTSFNDIEALNNYKKMEIMNVIIFVNNLIKPCSSTLMKLNFHFSELDAYFYSKHEIPKADKAIRILFESLELSIIIKLFISILHEKHIILMANQYLLLFSCSNALLNLIFPFKWLHTFIPVLPNDLIDFLDSPTPYIMGVSSLKYDFASVKEMYPNHIICDLNTSQINYPQQSKLPENEEFKLRKKYNYLKNNKLISIENIFNNEFVVDSKLNISFSYLNINRFSNNLIDENKNNYNNYFPNNNLCNDENYKTLEDNNLNFNDLRLYNRQCRNLLSDNSLIKTRRSNNQNPYDSKTNKFAHLNIKSNLNTNDIKTDYTNFFLFEDISIYRSFSENVQNMFFRILRNPLENFEKKYLKNNEFDPAVFLDSLDSDDYKDFWEKIIYTAAFEYFILSNQYLDDSNTHLFNNIIENENNEIYLPEIYHLCLNLPQSVTNLFSDFENRAKIIESIDLRYAYLPSNPPFVKEEKKHYINEFYERCKKCIKDYNTIMSYKSNYTKSKEKEALNNINSNNYYRGSHNNISSCKNKKVQFFKKSKNDCLSIKNRNNFSFDFGRNINNRSFNVHSNLQTLNEEENNINEDTDILNNKVVDEDNNQYIDRNNLSANNLRQDNNYNKVLDFKIKDEIENYNNKSNNVNMIDYNNVKYNNKENISARNSTNSKHKNYFSDNMIIEVNKIENKNNELDNCTIKDIDLPEYNMNEKNKTDNNIKSKYIETNNNVSLQKNNLKITTPEDKYYNKFKTISPIGKEKFLKCRDEFSEIEVDDNQDNNISTIEDNILSKNFNSNNIVTSKELNQDFTFYGKNGFVEFMNYFLKIIELSTVANITDNSYNLNNNIVLSDPGFNNDIAIEIAKHKDLKKIFNNTKSKDTSNNHDYNEIKSSSKGLNRTTYDTSCNNEEKCLENKNNVVANHKTYNLSSKYSNVLTNSINDNINDNNYESVMELSFSNYNSLRISLEKPKSNHYIIDLPKIDCFQYYQTLAFYMEEFCGNQYETIFNLYLKSAEKSIINFPFVYYNQFVEKLTLKEVESLIKIYLNSNINKEHNILVTNKKYNNSINRNNIQFRYDRSLTNSKSILGKNRIGFIIGILLLRRESLKDVNKNAIVKEKNITQKKESSNSSKDYRNFNVFKNKENSKSKLSNFYRKEKTLLDERKDSSRYMNRYNTYMNSNILDNNLNRNVYSHNFNDHDNIVEIEDNKSNKSTSFKPIEEFQATIDGHNVLSNFKGGRVSNENILKKNIINAINNNVVSTNNLDFKKDIQKYDAISLLEDICFKINNIISKYGLDKIKLESINYNIINDIYNSNDYSLLKNKVHLLSNINLDELVCAERMSINDSNNFCNYNSNFGNTFQLTNNSNFINTNMNKSSNNLSTNINTTLIGNLNNHNLQTNNSDYLSNANNTPNVAYNSNNNYNYMRISSATVSKKMKIKSKMLICFWLNLYNYLVIFTIFNKREYIAHQYDWLKILNNSNYDIGGLILSLSDIENFILKRTEDTVIKPNEPFQKILNSYTCKAVTIEFSLRPKFLNFGLSLPTKASPNLRIYFPINLEENLMNNAHEYLSKAVNPDISQNTIFIYDYLKERIDPNFIKDIYNYEE